MHTACVMLIGDSYNNKTRGHNNMAKAHSWKIHMAILIPGLRVTESQGHWKCYDSVPW